jgi:hypothetical protein
MARRKIPPMPIEGLIDHPKAIALPAAGTGMLWNISTHFWRTECAPLPKDDDGLAALARCHKPTWRHHGPTIKAILADLTPEIAKAFNEYQRKRAVLIGVGQKGHSALRLRALKKAYAKPQTDIAPPIMPVSAQANRASKRASVPQSGGFSEAA